MKYSKSIKGVPCVCLDIEERGVFRVFTEQRRHLDTIKTNLKSYFRKGKDLNDFKKYLNKKKCFKIAF